MSTPVRTCVGCRERQSQAKLLRLRRLGHGALAPASRRGAASTGRSAYLCPDRRCLDRAIKRGGLRRAFAREGRVNVSAPELWTALEGSILRRREEIERSAQEFESLPGYRQLHMMEAAMLTSRREA